ncbi:MAG: hypothetical protein ACI9AH_001315, partial [Oceanospirillaceae bacterium]
MPPPWKEPMLDKKAVSITLVDYQDPQQMALLIQQLGAYA